MNSRTRAPDPAHPPDRRPAPVASPEPQAADPGRAWPYPQRVLLAAAAIALLLLAWRLAEVVMLVFGGVVLAAVLRTLGRLLHAHLRVPQRVSVAAAIALVAGLFGLASVLVGDALAEQIALLRARVPQAWAAATAWLEGSAAGRQLLEMGDRAMEDGVVSGTQLVRAAQLSLGVLGAAVLLVIVGVYLALDPATYRRGMVRLVPPPYRERVDGAMRAAGDALSRWLLGQGVSMLFLGSATAIGLALLQVPLALSLGLITGLLAFVPIFGALAAGVLAVLLAFAEGPQTALYVALLFLGIQQIEEYLVLPLVQRRAVALPPVLSLVATLVFGLLFGPLGVLFATPMMVVAMVLVRTLYIEDVLEKPYSGA